MEYQSLREHLQSGRVAYDPLDLWECEDPDPENAPSNRIEAGEALYSLPGWAQTVCALTAAEMVLPLWEESGYAESLLPVPFWKLSELTDEDVATLEVQSYFAPRRVIETMWDSLDEEASDSERSRRLRAAIASFGLGVAQTANAATDTDIATYAAFAAAYTFYRDRPIAVAYAADAIYYAYGIPREDFYSWWWCNCKGRLAIMGAEEAELEWWQ